MNKLFALFFVYAGLSCSGGRAAEVSYAVLFPKGDAAWTVALEKGGPSPEAPKAKPTNGRTIKTISVIRKGNVRRDTVSWTDGSTTEYWWPGHLNIVLFQAEKDGPVRTMKSGIMGNRRFDETLFSSINAATFVENQTFRQKKCFYHEVYVLVEDGEKVRYQAWIEAETGKPVAWSDGVTVALFSFDTAGAGGPLVMSDKFQKEYKRMEAYYSAPKKSGT